MAGLRELKKRQTVRAILSTAEQLFTEKGYEKTAVSEIADGSCVATKTVYNYFSTKSQIAISILMSRTEVAAAEVETFLQSVQGRFEETMLAISLPYWDAVAKLDRALLREAIGRSISDPIHFGTDYQILLNRTVPFQVRRAIEGLRNRGELKESFTNDRLCQLVLGARNNVFIRYVTSDSTSVAQSIELLEVYFAAFSEGVSLARSDHTSKR